MAETKLTTGLSGRLEQKQLISQSQQRSLELLAMPLPLLESRLTEELAGNVLLEEQSDPVFSSSENIVSDVPENSGYDENDYEQNSILPEEWADDLPLPQQSRDETGTMDFLGNLPAPPPPLRTLLLSELHALGLPENLMEAASEIVSALNDDGYLTVNLADLAMQCDADMDEINEALHIVQSIAPAGVAARDLAECLKLQLAHKGLLTGDFVRLLDEGLPDLEMNRMSRLEKKLGITPEKLENMLKTLRSLNPAPGRSETDSTPRSIVPDLAVSKDENGTYTVRVRRPASVRLTVSPLYEKLLEDASLSPDDRAYLTEKLNRARELLRALSMRESTLKQLGEFLITRQSAFLDGGVDKLKGMTMKSAAAELGVNESTISRCVADKFIETPQGVFPLRFFFSGTYNSENGEDVSARAIQQKIKQLIASEDQTEPLSDETISRMLNDAGLPVARRTVAKYRELMNIPASALRKKFY